MLKEAVTFDMYDKASDDLFFMNNMVLRFNVIFSRKNEDGKKISFHNEYRYKSDKYIDHNELVTIRRRFDYFLTLENFKQDEYGKKEYIMIGINDIIYVQDCFKLASKWFRSKEFENLFVMDKKTNKIIMMGKPEPIIISGLPMGKSIKLEPIVMQFTDGSTSRGVRLSTSDYNYSDIHLDKFMGLLYLILNINMYQSAQIMLNYLQRPEYGTNCYSFDDYAITSNNVEDSVKTNSTRKIPDKRQKSFFDKMGEL